MNNFIVKIHNVETDEIIERPMNEKELDEYNKTEAQTETKKQMALDLEKLKASAKAKLIAGEPLTAAEADTLVI